MSKEEALQYLQLRKIDGKQAEQIYELVGGRMVHLKTFADEIMANAEFESMCSISMENRFGFSPFFTDLRIDMLRDSKTQLEIANVLPKQRYHKEGATIIRELLEKGSISYSTDSVLTTMMTNCWNQMCLHAILVPTWSPFSQP